jgi:hypothetical protein
MWCEQTKRLWNLKQWGERCSKCIVLLRIQPTSHVKLTCFMIRKDKDIYKTPQKDMYFFLSITSFLQALCLGNLCTDIFEESVFGPRQKHGAILLKHFTLTKLVLGGFMYRYRFWTLVRPLTVIYVKAQIEYPCIWP